VDGDKNYEIAGDSVQISQLAGQRVRVTGTLAAGRIKVSSATALVADGANPPGI
jgi:predicted metal-binding membrane protein